MHIYKRENGIYYYKRVVAGELKRFSLGVRDYRLAHELQELYDKDKFLSFHEKKKHIVGNIPLDEKDQEADSKIKKHNIKDIFVEFLEGKNAYYPVC